MHFLAKHRGDVGADEVEGVILTRENADTPDIHEQYIQEEEEVYLDVVFTLLV